MEQKQKELINLFESPDTSSSAHSAHSDTSSAAHSTHSAHSDTSSAAHSAVPSSAAHSATHSAAPSSSAPSSAPSFTIPTLTPKPPCFLNITLVMRNHAPILAPFITSLIDTLRNALPIIPMRQLEIVLIDYRSADNSLTEAKRLLQRHPSLYLAQARPTENIAQTIFRAWQWSRAELLGSIEIGDSNAITILLTMLAELRHTTTDLVIGRPRILPAQTRLALARQATARALLRMCGTLLAPTLFRDGLDPMNTAILIRRTTIHERRLTLHGDLVLPNLMVQIPTMRLTEITPAHPITINQKYSLPLWRIFATLFKISIMHKMRILKER